MTRREQELVAQAIRNAENGTTGRIAVRVVLDRSVDALELARREFRQFGLDRHENRNAALVLVAPNAKQFAVVGDRALHERVGDAFWDDVVGGSRAYFAGGDTLEGIRYAVGRIGEALQTHFALPQATGP